MLPFVKQAAKMTNQTQFLSNCHLARPVARAIQAPTSSSLDTSSAPKAITSPIIEQTQEIQREKRFNDDEERSLYGALEGEHEYVSPWLGAQALGLATALVMGSAALGMWGVAKAMGVKNVRLDSGSHSSRIEGRSALLMARWKSLQARCAKRCS